MTVGPPGTGAAPKGPSGAVTPTPLFDRQSGTQAATKRVLFGHLHTEDAASAIARRLRTAIGLGVLADGEKLPKEVDLARQLGVTAFSLREALGTLRGEGLIVTRVGKKGGSYVAHPVADGSMAGEELARFSAAELRDLGDWRAALTTRAAWLAARRAAGETAGRLIGCADEMDAAGTAAGARRALGRFHVELSAGAQSMRLTRAELTVHEEFDWLAQVLLGDEDRRHAVAESMRAVAAAVGDGDGSAASRKGERMVSSLVTELVRTRLQMIAAEYGSGRAGAGDLAAELRRLFGDLVRMLEELAADVAPVFARPLTSRGLNAEVARCLMPRLGTLDDVVHGLGFMTEVGVLTDAPYWMHWWQRAADGAFDRDYRHQMDPARDDFYDYASRDYMVRPRESGAPSAMGPYIDFGGVDDNIVTVSVPVSVGDAFVGIMAADIRMAALERELSPWLARADGVRVVLNSELRVLLSNSVHYLVGDVLSSGDVLSLTPVGCFSWLLGRADAAGG